MRKAVKTNVKKSDIKILPTTEALFEKICYLTKLSLKEHEGTEIAIDITDLANCLGINERTVRNHLKKLRESGMINRTDKHWRVYELHSLVLADLLQRKRQKHLRVYLKAIVHNPVDNLLFFPTVEKNSTAYNIDKTKFYKSNTPRRIFSKKVQEKHLPKLTEAEERIAKGFDFPKPTIVQGALQRRIGRKVES